MKVLYVEDAADQASVVLAFLDLSEKETDVCHVGTLRSALAELGKAAFDVILLDLGLPDGSGVELVKRVDKEAPATPIVVLTANEESGLGVACLEAGAQEFLSKLNLTPQRLTDCLVYAITRKREMAPALGRVLSRFGELHQGDFEAVSPELVERYRELLANPAGVFTDDHWDLGQAFAQDGISSEQFLALHESCLKALCAEVSIQERIRYLENSDMVALATIAFMSDTYRDLSIKASAKALSARVKRRKA